MGAGDLALVNSSGSGVAVFDFRPGSSGSAAFTDENGFYGYAGNWTINSNVEVRTLRNGWNAWGSGVLTLNGGMIAPQQNFNATWINNIVLQTGSSSTIGDRNSSGTTRWLKLQGVISGDGSLTFQNTAGTMGSEGFILTASNTLSGTVTIDSVNATVVRVGGVAGSTSDNSVGPGGTLGSASIVNNGTLYLTHSDTWVVSNSISGSGSVKVGGSASQVVSLVASNTYTGGTTFNAGTLLMGNANALGKTGINIFNGGTLASSDATAYTVSNACSLAGDATLGQVLGGTGDLTLGGAVAVTAGSHTLKVNNSATLSGVMSGGGSIIKAGSGTLTLSGANSYGTAGTTVSTTVNGGLLNVANASGLGGGTSGGSQRAVAVKSGKLDFTFKTGGYGSSVNNWTVGLYGLTMGGTSNATSELAASGVESGKPVGFGIGPGWGSAITYDASNNGGMATVSALWSSVGTTGLASTPVTVNDSTATLIELDFSGGISSTAQDDGDRMTLQKLGGGTMRISCANNLPGLQVSAGKLMVNHVNALGVTRSGGSTNLVTIDGSGVLDLNGFNNSIGGLSGGGASTGVILNNGGQPSTLTVGTSGANTTFGGAIRDGSNAVSLVKMGIGTLTLAGTNTFSGSTTVSNGVLSVVQPASLSSNTVLSIASSGVVNLSSAVTYQVHAFYVNGEQKRARLYDSSYPYITGPGRLEILSSVQGFLLMVK